MNQIDDLKRGEQLDRWVRAAGSDYEDIVERIVAMGPTWRVLIRMLKEMYTTKHVGEFDFSDPAFQYKLVYSEGYKRALQDVYNIIPDQGDTK